MRSSRIYQIHFNEKNDDHLSKVAYKYEKQMAETCNRPNLHSFLLEINNKVGNIVHQTKRKIKKLLESYYCSVWKDRLNQTNKSLTFRLYKENVTIAPYLLHVKNRKHRKAMSKLRLSDHNLDVEVGRHTENQKLTVKIEYANSAQSQTSKIKYTFY